MMPNEKKTNPEAGKVYKLMGFILLVVIVGAIIASAVGCTGAQAQSLRQNPQIFIGTYTNIQVNVGATACKAVSVGTKAGILTKIIVGGTNAAASGSTNFDVRITQKADCDDEDQDSIFQLENSTSVGAYPFGFYVTPIIVFKNADSPSLTENLYVRIKNDAGATGYFDVYLAGQKLDGSGT